MTLLEAIVRRITLAILIAIAQPQMALSEDWTLDASALLDFRGNIVDRRSTNLRPTQDLLNTPTESLAGTGVLSMALSKDIFLMSSQFRGFGDITDEEDASDFLVDELYWEVALGEGGFAFAGRKNLVRGPAYGISATDLFTDQTEIDRTLNENRRRQELEGTDAVGIDWFVSDDVTLLAIFAPEASFLNEDGGDRAELAANILFPEDGIDTTMLAFYDGDVSVGGSIATTVGDGFVLYGEVVARNGRDAIVPVTSNAALGTFVNSADSDSWFTSATLGGGYTSSSGTALNVEYFWNGSGLGDGEWDEVIDLIKTNAANLNRLGGLAKGNLLSLNEALRTATARRHYIFTRLAQPDLFSLSGLSGEITLFHELHNQSGTVNSRLEYDLSENAVLGLFGGYLYGADDTEFGLREDRKTGVVYVTVYF